jgi:lipopolysaccharide export system permease protein
LLVYLYNRRMTIYSNYIAKQLVHATLLITVSLTSIVWLMQALRFIDFIVNQGVSIVIFLKLTLLLVPSLLVTILPPAFFCAVIFTYHKLKTDSELIVLQAMGIDRWHLAAPALRVAMGFVVLAYGLALYVQPVSMRSFKDLQIFLRNNYVSILLQEGVFSTPIDGLTVFIRERHDDGTLQGILVQDSRKPDNVVTMMADRGVLVQTPAGTRFLLENGNRQEMKDGKLSFLDYESYTLDVSLYTDSDRIRTRDPQELFVGELLRNDPTLSEKDRGKRLAELHQRILWPANMIMLTLLALSVMLTMPFNRRGGWRRLTLMAATGGGLLLCSALLTGITATAPQLAFLPYLWWFISTAIAAYVLRREPHPRAEAAL